jgi:polysaccharide biosynthesis/export protein
MKILRISSVFTAMLPTLMLLAVPASAQVGKVGPNDLVRVTVFRKPELTAEMEVSDEGMLIHPLYRGLSVVGATDEELQQRIRSVLVRYEAEPSFVVERMVRVTVGGEVRQPNVYALRPSATLFEAVARAGGLTNLGRLSVALYRNGELTKVDLRNSNSLRDSPVRSGDLVVVERRSTALRDTVGPATSIVAAIVAVINLATR